MKTFKIKITGTTALLQNRFDEKAEASLGKSTRTVVRKKETPRKAAERACYQDKEGEYYMPAACITRMLSEAGSNHKLTGSRKSAKYAVYAAVFLPDETLTILNGDGATPAAKFEVDSRPVVIRVVGARIMRHRPRFDEWSIAFSARINDDVLPPDFVHQLMSEGGQQVGIGDFRPQCRGPFGTFNVVHWEELEE